MIPSPPADLAARAPRLMELPPGSVLHRFYPRGKDPIWFDRSKAGRLNSPDGGFGVLYAAAGRPGAFAETFLRRPGATVIDLDLVAAKGCARIRGDRPLRLFQLFGPGLSVLGAIAEVTHGGLPYDVPQAWSHALYKHPAGADGIAYRARHDDDEICFALFDRCAPALTDVEREEDIDRDWFWQLAERYGVGLSH